MNIKDSYLHSGTHLVKNISFAASGGVIKATITWALEGVDATEITLPTIGGASFGSQTANYVLAAPNGSAGTPTFRALDAADIPALDASKITSGTIANGLLPLATTSTKGAVYLGVAKTSDADSAVTGKKYWVKMNANGKLFVDIPWDTNTHYTAVPILGGSSSTSNATSDTANNATYLNIIENSAKSGGILITGTGATTVKAKSGKLTINSTNTWKAANNSQEGYVPQLSSGGTALSDSANDYILAFTYTDGTLTPSWKKLPANAYLNNTYTVNNATYSIKSKIGDTTTTLSDFTANQSSADDFTLIQGSNITFTNNTTNRTLTIAGTPDTKVTSVDNHYTPSADTNSELTASLSGTAGAYALNTEYTVLTGIKAQRDAKGHITGLTYTALKIKDTNSTGYLAIGGGTMTGAIKRFYNAASNDPMIALTSNNQDVWLWRINHGTAVSTSTSALYGFGLKYIGTGSGQDNNLVLYADNQTGTLIAAVTINQVGTVKFNSTPNVNGTNVSLSGHKHAYTDLTGSTTTANQAIVSSGTANGWTLKTLGSRAFDSTAYVPIAGNVTMTGPLGMTAASSSAADTSLGINFIKSAIIGHVGENNSGGLGLYATSNIYLRPSCTLSDGNFTVQYGLVISNTDMQYNGNTVYHSGNIPSNSASAKGVVPAGVASSVYMTDASKNPSWTSIDSTVTSGSSHLVTSGAVYTAIANNVASAVQYLGTITSKADMIALTGAGKGDFARVTASFSFTDASGASVTAHVGDVVYLTNNTPGTASNWIVAHTEIDTDTWTAASTSAAGYIPKLVTGGTNLAAASTDYVLSYVNGTSTPVWRKLPANAYNDTWIAWTGATDSAAGTDGYMPGAAIADRLKYLRGDGSWIALDPSISAGTSDTNAVAITVGGETSEEFTVPYATKSDTLDGYHAKNITDIYFGGFSAGGSSNTVYYGMVAEYKSTSRTVDVSATFLISRYGTSGNGNVNILNIRGRGVNKSSVSCTATWSLKTDDSVPITITHIYDSTEDCYYIRIYFRSSGWGNTYGCKLLSSHSWVPSSMSSWTMHRGYTSEVPSFSAIPLDETVIPISNIGASNKEATIGTSLTTIATVNGVDITAKIDSYSASSHTHKVSINGVEKTIAATSGTAVDLGSYLPLSGGTMTGNIVFDSGFSEKRIYFDINRKSENGGLWAYDYLVCRDVSNSMFFNTGVFGKNTTFNYAYIGVGGFASTYNFRIYSDKVTYGDNLIAHAGNISDNAATIGTTATTLATIAGINITASLPIAARGESTVTSGVITPTSSGTTKFLCEDGTWKLPSYTTNTDEKVKLSESTTASYRGVVLGFNTSGTANAGISGTVTDVVYTTNNLVVLPSTGSISSKGSITATGGGTFSNLTCTTNGITFKANTSDCPILWNSGSVHQRIVIKDDTETDTTVFTFQQSTDSGTNWANLMTIRDNSKVVATTFVGALSGNASTASNLSKTDGRGYLYLSANTTTGYTGVGSVSAASEIGLPYIGYSGSANTYGVYKDLFYLSGTTKYIGNDVHSNKFACVKTKDSITDDWTGSTTSGSQTSGSTSYTAGTGININNGVISTTRNEWYGTEALFNSLASLDSNTTYYIMTN